MFHLFRARFRGALSLLATLPALSCLVIVGCGRFSPGPAKQYVYVSVKEMFPHDRLAAVSERVEKVVNGERLLVVDQDRHFYKVRMPDGKVGWVDDREVIDQKTYDQFMALRNGNAHDPVVATAVLNYETNVHLAPGRDEVHFYMLPYNTKLELLRRASVPKPLPPQAVPVPLPVVRKTPPAPKKKIKRDPNAPPYVPSGPPMEDWWLVRGPKGQTGWVLSRMMDVVIPQELAGLAGDQRYVAAYQIRTVNDPGSRFPNGQAPEFVAVTNAWKDGLPYDFDQLHVFTWDVRRHRYELAFRDRGIEGYLPVTIGSGVFNGKTEPTFSFKEATDNQDMVIDPVTGAAHSAHTIMVTYRLEGVLVRRIGPPETKAKVERAAERTQRHNVRRHRERR
ncbi:MAG TPA: SH3 domain-containing protein [Acidobacteriaceae bacterium]|nr:SH3 domain-containing protein [Acidobacteriaceae bacterium]